MKSRRAECAESESFLSTLSFFYSSCLFVVVVVVFQYINVVVKFLSQVIFDFRLFLGICNVC